MPFGIDANTFIQLATIVFTAGMGWMKLKVVERDLMELKKEVVDFRDLKKDLAVLQVQLTSIHDILKKLTEKEE